MSKLPTVPDAGTTSTRLLRLVQQQDEDAWRRLETIYRPLVFYWCDVKSVHVNNWEDIAQAVFMTLHKYIGEFTKFRGKTSFRPWLRRVTASRIADFKESNKNAHALFSETSLELIRHLLVTKIREEEPTDEAVERQIAIRQVMEDIKRRVNVSTWEAFQQTANGRRSRTHSLCNGSRSA